MDSLRETQHMEKLIECVKKYPCIWNVEIEEYKSLELKENVWKDIAKQCGYPNISIAKIIWKRLRDGHRQAISRRKSVPNTRHALWKYEQQMAFLLPVIKPRKRRQYELELDDFEEGTDQDDNIVQLDSEHTDEYEIQNEKSYSSMGEHNSDDEYTPQLKIKREEQTISRDKKRPTYNESKHKYSETAMDKFFSSMLLTTNSLPQHLQMKVQREIFNSVMSAREEQLATQSPCTSTPVTSTNPLCHFKIT